MTTTTTATLTDTDTGRTLDPAQLRAQMGMDFLAVSGGRLSMFGPSTALLPVGQGYWVGVTIDANDTYTVTRLRRRKGLFTIKGTMTDVYADEVGEAAYRASCWRDAFPAR